jgi:hypothetical protein
VRFESATARLLLLRFLVWRHHGRNRDRCGHGPSDVAAVPFALCELTVCDVAGQAWVLQGRVGAATVEFCCRGIVIGVLDRRGLSAWLLTPRGSIEAGGLNLTATGTGVVATVAALFASSPVSNEELAALRTQLQRLGETQP